jgi:hypothetical protein
MIDKKKEKVFAKSFLLWFCELFPCCSTLFRFFSSVIGAIIVILQFLSLLWPSTMTSFKWALSSFCHFPFFYFIIISRLPLIVILGDLAPPMLFLLVVVPWSSCNSFDCFMLHQWPILGEFHPLLSCKQFHHDLLQQYPWTIFIKSQLSMIVGAIP